MIGRNYVLIILIIAAFMVSVIPVSALPITTQDMTVSTQATLKANFFDPLVTTYTNFSLIGANNAIGLYDGATEFDIPRGVLISSGNITSIIGPNLADSMSTVNGVAGDADLDNLAQVITNDAAGFEFDITPTKNYLVFHYLFGSEEYNEFVGSFNDVFGFFVDGVNCATFQSGEYVSVNNVNNDSNRYYYHDNDPSDTTIPYDTEMDGFTSSMYAVAGVTPGIQVHVKIVVADAIDSSFDTNVLIEQYSFTETDSPPNLPVFIGKNNAVPSVSTRPLAMLNLERANKLWECISENLPDEIDEDVMEKIDQVQAQMSKVIALPPNPVYVNGVLLNAIDLMKEIAEGLELPCYLER